MTLWYVFVMHYFLYFGQFLDLFPFGQQNDLNKILIKDDRIYKFIHLFIHNLFDNLG